MVNARKMAQARDHRRAARARGDHRPDSDTALMVEIDPAARIGVWGHVGLSEHIADFFGA